MRELHVCCLRRAPRFFEKRKERRDAVESATGDDIVTPDSKAGAADEDQIEHRNGGEKRKAVPGNGSFPAIESIGDRQAER